MINQHDEEKTISFLQKNKIANLKTIADSLNSSVRTAQRKLKTWKAYRSYNKNSSYFTLPSIPNFDQNGLWQYKGTFFSKHGNLKETIKYLVYNSLKGLNAHEIGNILEISSRSFSSYFNTIKGFRREKHEGIIIYFSDDSSIYKKQKVQRQQAVKKNLIELPSNDLCIIVLVDLIKHQGGSITACWQRLQRRGVKIKKEEINKLLSYHGIKKKQDMK
jgi:hypothetical protein